MTCLTEQHKSLLAYGILTGIFSHWKPIGLQFHMPQLNWGLPWIYGAFYETCLCPFYLLWEPHHAITCYINWLTQVWRAPFLSELSLMHVWVCTKVGIEVNCQWWGEHLKNLQGFYTQNISIVRFPAIAATGNTKFCRKGVAYVSML